MASALPELSPTEAALLKRTEGLAPAQAIDLLERELPKKTGAAMQFSLGSLHYQASQPQRALQCYLKAVELMPEFRQARLNAARLLLANGQATETLPLIQPLLKEPDTEAWTLLAKIHLKLGEPLASEKASSQAIALNPRDSEARPLLLQALLAQPGRLQEAASLARQMLEQEPQRSQLWRIWASAELESGHTTRAMAILETASHFSELDAEMERTLLGLYLHQGFSTPAGELAIKMCMQGQLPAQQAQATLGLLQTAGALPLAQRLQAAITEHHPSQIPLDKP